MKIVIETIPHDKQRYATAGDWVFEDGELHIFVSALGDPDMEACVAVHELAEALLCEKHGIPEPAVRAFDEANPESDDPGSMLEAPYHKEHVFAETIEWQLAEKLGVDWGVYGQRIEALFP